MMPERWARIEHLYHAALERSPDEREAFLDEACAGDGALRRQVAALLVHDDQASSIVESPVLQVAAQALAAVNPAEAEATGPQHTARQIGAYQLLEPLGRGGMGEVRLALDPRLGRKVAIKLLPPEFTTDAERVRRFEQEARAASALNHPNIITIHEIGEGATETGATRYIVTEYVEGETLRQKMTNSSQRQLKPSEAVDIASQIAAALAAAHEAGIVHRDIKPENVMVRGDRLVKVLDFGLAKLTEEGQGDKETRGQGENPLTFSGVVLGTPRYMSPEQARGEKMDARTDLFSLGVMLYEMITGRPPFAGATTSDLIAAILKDEPPPVADQAPGTPPELQQIISEALRKDRVERYQSAKELQEDLKELKYRLEVESKLGEMGFEARASGGGLRYSSQPAETGTLNTLRRRATIIAVAALVAAVIGGLVAWTYLNRHQALTEKDTILLADFENKTGEEIFDKLLKQGLAIQLEQSPFLNLFPEAQMRHELRLMKRSPSERVTAEVAREICERHNLKALIAGSIAPLGSHYVITLEVVNGQSGEALAREQVEAENKEQVLRMLSQAATQLREKLGESLSSIQRFDRPLQESTTARPEAFKVYSQALELAVSGRMTESIPFFQHAVELDPDFAIAHSHLAIMYVAIGKERLAVEYAKKSYELRDRAGDLEKFRIIHKYYSIVTGDLSKAIESLRLQRRTYPREWTGPHDLALVYNQIGRAEEAIAEARESIRLNPNFSAPYTILALVLLRLNRFAESKDVAAQAFQQGLDHRWLHFYLYQLAFINSDTTGMQQQLDWTRGKPDEYVALDWQASAAVFAGQWRRAQDFSRRAIDLAVVETIEVAARYTTEQALRGAALGDCRQARASAAQGLKLSRGRSSLSRAALALALCGETNQAGLLAAELGKSYPEDTLINSIWLPTIRAAVGFQRGDSTQAIEQLQATTRYEAAAEFWPEHLRGLAYLKLKQGAAAAAEFRKILDHRGYAPLSPLYPLAHLGLARAAALTGDVARSRKAYEDFFAVWKGADPDLPPMIAARREYEP